MTVPINLTPRARDIVDGFKANFGIAKQEGVARALELFASLPPKVQQEALRRGGDPIGMLLSAKLAEAQAAGDISGMSIDDALKAIRVLLDRVETISDAHQEQFGKSKKGK